MTKFLTLGSAILAGANVALAVAAGVSAPGPAGAQRITGLAEVPESGSLLFTYPTPEDPCILVRGQDGAFHAFSQVCTHLACAVIHRPEEKTLFCPCHHGYFADHDGEPTAGPPTRRLPRIRLEQRGEELWAVGVEV